MDSALISVQNPWWETPRAIEEDFHLKAIVGKSYYFPRATRQAIQLTPPDFHILRGPRQVGKTTLLKEWIFDLLQSSEVPPQRIFFLSCESLLNFSELQKHLTDWLIKNKNHSVYVFLDEVSFVLEWQRAILACMNMGLLENACLVVTGSNARDLKESSERFPGRRAMGQDISVYPLSIIDWAQLKCCQDWTDSKLVEVYLKVGGFPHAVRDYIEHGGVTDATFRTYQNWIVGDATRYGLSEELMKHILFRIYSTFGSRITWSSLIETTSIRSHETALNYVEHLQDAFLCQLVYAFDPEKKRPSLHKSRKLYFIDPLLYAVAHAWQLGEANIWNWIKRKVEEPEYLGRMLESTYLSTIARGDVPTYFWYSTKQKKEVDLLLQTKNETELFEVKLQARRYYKALGKQVKTLSTWDLIPFLGQRIAPQ